MIPASGPVGLVSASLLLALAACVLPPGGSGGFLTVSEPDGTRSEWHRPVE